MEQKKARIIFGAIVLVSIGIIGLGTALFVSRKDDQYIKSAEEGDISRYEWMQMLCEQSGLTEYKSADPYFEDVNATNPYFSYIQSAVEWDVLSGKDKFEGDGYASGRFVAMTAMKSIGERKLMMYLETENTIKDDTCLELAMEHGLIEKDKLAEGVSEEECTQILETLQNLYFGEFWKDDYSRVVYQDGVRELSPDEVMRSNVDGTEIVVSDHAQDTLETGAIIVYEEKNTKLKYARKISDMASDGTVSLEPVELEQAVESFTVSDIREVTFEDIISGYASDDLCSLRHPDDWQDGAELVETRIISGKFSGNMSRPGFKLTFSTKENKYLEVKITDHGTGVSRVLPIEDTVELEGDYSAELDIDKILIGAQADWTVRKGGLQYADVAVDVYSKFKGEVKTKEEIKLPLYKSPVPLPLPGGVAGVDLQFYLVLSVKGTISIEAELPMGVSVTYEKDKGLRHHKHEIETNSPKMEANCDVGVYIRFEPILVILGDFIKILDVEADVGATASAKNTLRPNAQDCTEIAMSFPVITLSVGGDDDIETWLDTWGVSAEWKIIKADEAPVHINTHFELLPDGTEQFVNECTYKEEENEEETDVEEEESAGEEGDTQRQPGDASRHTYYTQQSDTKFAFDYPDGWSFDAEESRELSGGFKEAVVFKNDRGVLLQYWEQENNDPLGGAGHFLSGVEVTKAEDSSLDGFVVGKIKCTSAVDYPSGEEIPLEDGSEMYAVIPKDKVGTNYYGGAYFADNLSFIYRDSTYYFSASAPEDGKFTEEEEKEVLAILSSFREVP